MQTYCKENLIEIKLLLQQLSQKRYTQASTTLFGATIGQHVRHILEFYESVFKGLPSKVINYDARERKLIIETDVKEALQFIDVICDQLALFSKDEIIVLEGNFCANKGEQLSIKSSYYRELAYCLEHSIHHQALIKVGLLEQQCVHFIDDTFGIAPATIRHRKMCV